MPKVRCFTGPKLYFCTNKGIPKDYVCRNLDISQHVCSKQDEWRTKEDVLGLKRTNYCGWTVSEIDVLMKKIPRAWTHYWGNVGSPWGKTVQKAVKIQRRAFECSRSLENFFWRLLEEIPRKLNQDGFRLCWGIKVLIPNIDFQAC